MITLSRLFVTAIFPLIGVLYHIESSPGPRESLYFYDEFMDLIESKLDERREELWS